MDQPPSQPRRGRGAASNPKNRYERCHVQVEDDGWGGLEAQVQVRLPTRLIPMATRHILARNRSPDVPFDRSVNPYRGCEHGCIYCFARPSHAQLGYSPGLDFETCIHYKPEAAERLREALAAPGYVPAPLALGINTDGWQPVERRLRLSRQLLEVLLEARHPVSIVTKSALIERDIDLLAALARRGLVHVALSVTTLDTALARRMEPRATAPPRRIETLRRLHQAGIPVGVLVAPVIPFLNDGEMERILAVCREAGAGYAGYVLLRLPHEVGSLFEEWLGHHYPERRARILARIRDCHRGRRYDATFGHRMRGAGVYAQLVAARFRRACRRLGYGKPPALEVRRFRPPGPGGQLSLF
ncbi:MAG: PA0069 family radical SAM protein [Gammaproteobacteria bacterium]|nr:MAG: PA0069 family radical SAM protein [Gammaproteobacteria bacterium]